MSSESSTTTDASGSSRGRDAASTITRAGLVQARRSGRVAHAQRSHQSRMSSAARRAVGLGPRVDARRSAETRSATSSRVRRLDAAGVGASRRCEPGQHVAEAAADRRSPASGR